jgi:hypothetical protein
VKLRHDDTLGSVDDERSVVGHQRDLAEENVLFLDVADRSKHLSRVLVIDRQTDLDLERDAVGHAALLAFLLVVFVFEADRLAAVVAERRADGIKGSAILAENLGRVERVHLDLRRAVLAICSQVLQAFEVAALALPVADLVLDVLERRRLAKI